MFKIGKILRKVMFLPKLRVFHRKNGSNMHFWKLVFILMLILQSISIFLPIVPAPPISQSTLYDRGMMYNLYKYDNHTYSMEIGSYPMNYENETGWYPINPNFKLLQDGHPAKNYNYEAGCEEGLFNVYLKNNSQMNYPIAFAYNKSDEGNTSVLRSKLLGVGYLDPSQNNEYIILQNVLDSDYSFSEATVTYEDVFTGTDAKWTYQETKLKEEIIMNSQTKTMLQNNPPSDYGLSNSKSYLVFITKLDYKELNVWNGTNQETGNFTTDDEITFKDVLGEVKFAFPVGYVYEQNNENVSYKVVSRIIQYNDNNYLLSGIKCVNLNNMTFPVVVDPSAAIVAASHSKSNYYDFNSNWNTVHDAVKATANASDTYLYAGPLYSAPNYAIWRSYLFFDTSGFGLDTKSIDSACLHLTSTDAGTEVVIASNATGYVHPETPPALEDYNYSLWGGHLGHNEWTGSGQTRNITMNADGLQHIFNTVASKQGTHTRFILRSYTYDYNDSAPSQNERVKFAGYNYAGVSQRPRLYINYTTGLTVTTNASNTIEETTATLNGWLGPNGTGTYQGGFWVNDTTGGHNVSAGAITLIAHESKEFDASDTNLSAGTYYTVRAWIRNATYFYNATNTITFHTKPNNPTNLYANHSAYNTIDLEWTKSSGDSNIQTVVVRNGSNWNDYPINPQNGTVVYNSTGNSYSDNALYGNKSYLYSAWSYLSGNFSDANNTNNNLTPPGDVRGLNANLSGANLVITWKQGYGTDRTVIRRNTNSYPTSPTDGTAVYNGTAETTSDTFDITQYYTAWAFGKNTSAYRFSAANNLLYGSLGTNCFDERNNTPLTFDLEITNEDASITYNATGCTNTHYINLNDVPYGDNTVFVVSSEGYKDRIYYHDLEERTEYNFSFYLVYNTSDIHLYYFQVLDEYDYPIDEAEVNISVNVNNSYKQVALILTDSNGQGTIYLNSSRQYQVTITKSGYTTELAKWDPDPNNYGIYYPKYFRMELEEVDIDIYGFWDIIDFTAVMNDNNTITVNYYDSYLNTTDAQFRTMMIFNLSESHVSWNNTTGNWFNFTVTGINISRQYKIIIYLNHTNLGYEIKTIIINPIATNYYTDIYAKFTAVFGEYDVINIIILLFVYIPALVILTWFAKKRPGIGTIGAGLWMGFIGIYFAIPAQSAALVPLIIAIGCFLVWKKRGNDIT